MSPEGRQQLIALALGLIFIVGFVLVASKVGQIIRDQRNKTKVASGQISPTPVATIIRPSPSLTPIKLPESRKPVTMEKTPGAIPNTGVETPILAFFGSLLTGGILLRRISRS